MASSRERRMPGVLRTTWIVRMPYSDRKSSEGYGRCWKSKLDKERSKIRMQDGMMWARDAVHGV